jgi:hypothetical protein
MTAKNWAFPQSLMRLESTMQIEGLAFVTAIHSITLPDGDLVDVIELGDGRVIAIDGERAVLHDGLDTVTTGIPNAQQPSIPL